MAKQHVHAVVDSKNYVYRGNQITKGRVVRMSAERFERTQRVIPPDFRLATEDEVKKAEVILDLGSIETATAQNVEEAKAAEAAQAPARKK